MINGLLSSQKVHSEIKSYRLKINSLTNETIKQKANMLLQDLQTQISIIDNAHSTKGNNLQIDPLLARQNVPKIIEIRKQLTKLLS